MKRRIAFALLTAAVVSAIGSGAPANAQFREVIINSPATVPIITTGATCNTVTSAAVVEGAPILLPKYPAHISIQRLGFDRFFHSF